MCSCSGFYLLGFLVGFLFVCLFGDGGLCTCCNVKMSEAGSPHLPPCLRPWGICCFASASSGLTDTQGSGASVHLPSSCRNAVIASITMCLAFTWTLGIATLALRIELQVLSLTDPFLQPAFFKEYAGCCTLSQQPSNTPPNRGLLAKLRKEVTC